jgi:hypothetical protein
VLGVLRTEGEAAPRQPALGLNRLAGLTEDAGFPVHTRIMGGPRVLPAEVDRAAYRIVQEALTNVRRHAGPGPEVLVEITYQPAALALSITDTGPVAEHFSPGSGITGMRARAESLGGRLAAGPGTSGGFGVTAVLPAPPVLRAPEPPPNGSPGPCAPRRSDLVPEPEPDSPAPGSVAPDSAAPDSAVSGSVAPGSVAPDSAAPDSAISGSVAPVPAAPDSAVSGSAALGSAGAGFPRASSGSSSVSAGPGEATR